MQPTPEMQITPETKKKLRSKEWRMNNLYKVLDKRGQLVTFKFNDVQKILFENMEKQSPHGVARNIILKARQFGVTTLYIIYALDDVFFNKGYAAEFISIGEDEMKKTFDKVSVAWENFVFKELYTIKSKSTSMLHLNNNSSIRVSLSSRSGTVQFLHISELGKIGFTQPLKAEEIKTGSLPAVPKGGQIIIESTAQGATGLFYDFWIQARKSDDFYKPHFLPWFFDKDYTHVPSVAFTLSESEEALKEKVKERYDVTLSDAQMMFYRNTKAEQGEKMNQEYPTFEEDAFLASGRPVFDSELLKISCKEEAPIDGVEYVLSADPADLGADYSVAKVMNRCTGEIVLNYEKNVPLEHFAEDLLRIGYEYNNALLIYESTGLGIALRPLLSEYPNLYTSVKRTKISDEFTEVVGFNTNAKTKNLIISELQMSLREGWISLSDKLDIEQLKVFQYKDGGKMEAPSGHHDDRVMGLALANHVCLERPTAQTIEKPKLSKYMERMYNRFRSKSKNKHW